MTTRIPPPSVRPMVTISLFGLALIATRAACADQLVEVAEARWTRGVSAGQYVDTVTAAETSGPVYLWMRLAGRRTALEELRANGKLPIRHKWFKCNQSCVFDQTLAPIDAVALDVGRTEVLEPLGRELSSRGFFDWRTWSVKERLRRGTWIVRVVYRDNTPVLCPHGTPCEYWIDVN